MLVASLSPLAASGVAVVFVWVAIALAWTLFWLPSVIALLRCHPRAAAVVFLNVVLAWTVVWWFVALGIALSSGQRQEPSYRQPSYSPLDPAEDRSKGR